MEYCMRWEGKRMLRWSSARSTPAGARVQLLTSAGDFSIFMSMLANGGRYDGVRYLAEGTVRMLTSDQLDESTRRDFENPYLGRLWLWSWIPGAEKAGTCWKVFTMGYIRGHLGGPVVPGTWVEADPITGISIAYMHNMIPNEELYHHHRMRNVVYGCL